MSTIEFTPDVVRATKFRDKLRGYHPEEVEAFLERTATALELLQTRLTETTERALKAEAALESNSETDESIRRTLTLAQRTAEMAVSEAREDAERCRSEATAEADRLRNETEAECARLVEEAQTQAATLRDEAIAQRESAENQAATTVAEAEAKAKSLVQSAQDKASSDEAAADERIATAQREADASQAAQAIEARRALDATVASLTSQRAELRVDVGTLAAYLATERARVLDVLRSGLDGFGESLTPNQPPAAAEAEVLAAEVLAGGSVAPEPVVWFPEDVPTAAEEEPKPADEPPSILLFTVEDELRRAESDDRSESRSRKPLLGRRKA